MKMTLGRDAAKGWQDSHACTKRRLRRIFRSAYTGVHSENRDKCEYWNGVPVDKGFGLKQGEKVR